MAERREGTMTVKQQLIQELEGLPPEAQKKILKLVHFLKDEILTSSQPKPGRKKVNALLKVDSLSIETGIADLAAQHDHYLYGVPKG
jgi:hypothetical protein